jgi:hypothetical protein
MSVVGFLIFDAVRISVCAVLTVEMAAMGAAALMLAL